MEKLIPSKKQWSNWSLPSKLTAIGCLLGVFSLLFSVVVYFTGTSQESSPGLVSDSSIGERIGVQLNKDKSSDKVKRFTLIWPEELEIDSNSCSFSVKHLPLEYPYSITAISCYEVEVEIEIEIKNISDIEHAFGILTESAHIPFPELSLRFKDGSDMSIDLLYLEVAISSRIGSWLTETYEGLTGRKSNRDSAEVEISNIKIDDISVSGSILKVKVSFPHSVRTYEYEVLYASKIDQEPISIGSTNYVSVPFSGTDKFYLWVRHKKNSKIFGPFEQTGLFEKAIRNKHLSSINKDQGKWDSLQCQDASCDINSQCYAVPVSIFLKNAFDEFTEVVKFPTCKKGDKRPTRFNRESILCENSDWLNFNFGAGGLIEGEIRYQSLPPVSFNVDPFSSNSSFGDYQSVKNKGNLYK